MRIPSVMRRVFGSAAGPRPPAAIPDGLRIYAVGDIHGRADLLGRLAGIVAEDLEAHPVPEARTIFLGDYIDRGPDSADVVDRLVRADFRPRW